MSSGPVPPLLYLSVLSMPVYLFICLSARRSNQTSGFFCLQLMGFIYACYVVKLISEEEDSCKYTLTHISVQTSHVFCNKAVCSCVSVCYAALCHLFSFTGSLQGCWNYGKAIAHKQLFIIAAAWGPMSHSYRMKIRLKQAGIYL